MKKILALILAMTVLFAFAACGSKPAAETPATAPAAEAAPAEEPAAEAAPAEEAAAETPAEEKTYSGEVNVYLSAMEDFNIALKENFEAAYPGITLNYVNLGGGEMFTRIRAEADNPQTDIVMLGSVEFYMNAAKDGLLMSYVPEVAKTFPEGSVPENGCYVVGLTSSLAIVYDKDWYDANNVPYPTCWDDLLIPELEGNVIIQNPGTSSTGYMVISTMTALRGEEAAMQFMADLNKNIKTYAKGGTGPVNSVSLGECAVGTCYLPDGIQLFNQGYSNLGFCVPREGTGRQLCCSAVVNNCKNVENAQLFQKWYLEEGCKTWEQLGIFETLRNPAIPTNEMVLEIEGDAVDAPIDYVWAAENYDRLVEQWDAIVNGNQ